MDKLIDDVLWKCVPWGLKYAYVFIWILFEHPWSESYLPGIPVRFDKNSAGPILIKKIVRMVKAVLAIVQH